MSQNAKKTAVYVVIIAFFILTAIFESVKIEYSADPVYNRFLSEIVPLIFGSIAVFIVLSLYGVKIFSRPRNLLYLLPCLVVAVNNFPFFSYFNGNMQLVHTRALDFILFGLYCLLVGAFEEGVFRGLLFPTLASLFERSKKGLWISFILTSCLFGFTHLFNLFSGADFLSTLLQVGYSILTGGLFTFVLLKTKNLFLCILTHSIYNFCGLHIAPSGLGSGVVFDLPTLVCMAVVAVMVGVFVLVSVARYSEEERYELYVLCKIEK